jgi:hypothetical protein
MRPAAVTVFLKNFFSRKDVSLICFILAIVIKLLLVFYFQQVGGDKLFQVMAGKNLAEGHGLTIKQVHVSNLSKEIYERFVGWPPAYSVLFAIIYSLVNNIDASCFIIDILSVIAFFFLLKKLLRQLEFPDYLINLLVLFYGCSMPRYIMVSMPTDFLTLMLILYTCVLTIELFRKKKPVVQGILLGFFNALLAWFRYMYIPVAFVIPAILLLNGWLKKDKKLLMYGAYTLVVALLSSIALLHIQEPYVVPTEKGIFWSNLLYISPVLFSAFIELNFLLMQFSYLTGLSYRTSERILQAINLVLLLFFFAFLLYSSLKRKWLAANVWQLFMIIGSTIAISIFAVLAYLSVTHSMQSQPPQTAFWTYVSEDRYYVFLQLFIVIITTHWLFMNATAAFSLRKWAQGLFLFLFSIVILHDIYYLARNFTFDRRKFPQLAEQNHMSQYITNTIEENKKKNIDVVFAGNYPIAHYAVLMGGKGLFVPSELNAKEMHADKTTKVFAVLTTTQFPFYSPFLKKEGLNLETQIGNYYFYSYYVKPNITLQN